MFEAEVPYAKKSPGGPRVSPERREWIKKESTMIYTRNLVLRDKSKARAEEENKKLADKIQAIKDERAKKWKKLTSASPFAVDLVAEDERISEEATIRLAEEERKRKEFMQRREQAKNEIVLKALAEFSDLEALRREKRAILEEEQRLKALLALELASGRGKADRLAAQRAQRQRREAKATHRRQAYQDSLDEVMEEESTALRHKHGVPKEIKPFSQDTMPKKTISDRHP